MELRHSKVEVASHVLQKGGRCPSTASKRQRISSAVNEFDNLMQSGSSSRSFHSAHFKEVELTRSVSEESIDMKKKILPRDDIEMANREQTAAEASYDNPGLDLTEENSMERENSSKTSISSAHSKGLVLGKNKYSRNDLIENSSENNALGISAEAQKYSVPEGSEASPIHVKAANAYQCADNCKSDIKATQPLSHSNSSDNHADQAGNLAERADALPKLAGTCAYKADGATHHLREESNGVNCHKDEFLEFRKKIDQEFFVDDQPILKRSKTQETNSSVPSTSYTCDSSQVPPSSNNGDSIRDETLRIGDDSTDFGSSSISQSSTDRKGPAKQFEAPEGVSATSMKTYQIVEKDGVRLGRCFLMTMVMFTFFVTMVLAILLLLMPTSAQEKSSGNSLGGLTRGTTLLPGLRSMKSGRSLVKTAEHLHKMPTLNLTLPPHNAPL